MQSCNLLKRPCNNRADHLNHPTAKLNTKAESPLVPLGIVRDGQKFVVRLDGYSFVHSDGKCSTVVGV